MRRLRASLGLVLAAGLVIGAWLWRKSSLREANERAASASIKTIASAQAGFRSSDMDGNKINDFWTGDVAALYYLPDPLTQRPIALIEKEIADADPEAVLPGISGVRSKAGYYFMAMLANDDGPYGQDTKGERSLGAFYHHSKFGVCAYPADYPSGGRWTFVINEGNTVFKFDTGGEPMLRWPASDALKGSLRGD